MSSCQSKEVCGSTVTLDSRPYLQYRNQKEGFGRQNVGGCSFQKLQTLATSQIEVDFHDISDFRDFGFHN
tara:strand:+ start:495 stop:704 length:210 start_codon:yes stop_codon:yes gene_type:complete